VEKLRADLDLPTVGTARNLSPKGFLMTVPAKGFAPQRRELPSEKGLAPVKFVLQPAKLLLGRAGEWSARI
jgi:hypothetical protein